MDTIQKSLLESLLGSKIRIKTLDDEGIDGEIFSYDNNTGCVALSISHSHTTLKKTFRIIKTSFIKEIQFLEKKGSLQTELNLPPINVQKIRSKEDAAIRQTREEVARIGVGVSKEAQDIFNALSKTLPCRWHTDTIVVLDEVLIKNPYGVENCQGSNSYMLERVKKVLEGEKRKIQSK
eukprot:TRINITY_DN2022_c2_g1_i4.p1 TRINITY_DN2022_c2_g1~~TRINITY_DN2022_c2_g1_i4.p1  ORF type:complete len:179 (-),score=26.09 TRINITY_DN2022_c2_g1_i4:273-809(-)